MRSTTPWTYAAIVALTLASAGCTGGLSEDGAAGPRGQVGCRDGCNELPAPASRVPRLSHTQWENTTRDLLRLPAAPGLSDAFIGDPTGGVFDNDGSRLSVGAPLRGDYQLAAETLAESVALDPDALAALVPAGAPEETSARLRAFVEDFAPRAYRRPLEGGEADRLVALATLGPMHYPEHDAFAGGVRLVLEAILQSASFLYRVELSVGPDVPIVLNDYEIASRLSFALWNSMPDDELFAAAARGGLGTPDEVREQAERMLDDPRAHEMVARFHHQWLDADRFADLTRSTDLFPEFNAELPASMEQEAMRFVDLVVFEDEGGFAELMTAPFTVADEHIARVYGLPAPATPWERVMPEGRAGLFTQIGFLAAQSTSIDPDPIHRGVHINRRVLCADLPSPPMNAPGLPPEDTSMPKTMRQRVDEHTGEGTCGARCHGTMINPIGFAFEHYDALGRWRDEDNGFPVDASASYAFESGVAEYADAVELSAHISQEQAAHRCYSGHWLEYLFGRSRSRVDDVLVRRIADRSLGEDLSVRGQIIELVTSEAFLSRSVIELEGPITEVTEEEGS